MKEFIKNKGSKFFLRQTNFKNFNTKRYVKKGKATGISLIYFKNRKYWFMLHLANKFIIIM